jgi:PadR family transcriptional regulator, regulatory protein PadR
MIETRLGDFEEVVLLVTGILGNGEAYALKIAEEFKRQTGREVSVGAVHSTLDRLELKGFVRSELGEATAIRGGKRKRLFALTALGKRVLQEAMDFRISLWKQYPLLAGKLNFNA